MAEPKDDPVLKRFRKELDAIYGDRIERVVLYGSRARGEAHADSDYDVAVFLKDLKEGDIKARGDELYRLADLGTKIIEETGEFVHAMPYWKGCYDNSPMPLMYEIRREGIDI